MTRTLPIQVPEWHQHILDERVEAYRANPEEGRPWEEVYEDLQRKLQDHRRKVSSPEGEVPRPVGAQA